MKKILFLSALDFKEKSIQVIRKTPEEYAKSGWEVNYIVARDTSEKGNYFYERELSIEGVSTSRFLWPFPKIRAVNNRYVRLFFSKISGLIVILKLFFYGFRFLMSNRDCYYVYGYEMHGVLASNLLKLFFCRREIKYISRFQGVFYIKEHLEKKRYLSIVFNLDTLLALWLPASLMIMTNDGTKGDWVLSKIKSRARFNYLFLPNGVQSHRPSLLESRRFALMKGLELTCFNFLMVSRLTSIKRVNLAIEAYNEYIKKGGSLYFKIVIVGDGDELGFLKSLASKYNLGDKIVFLGALENKDVYKLMRVSKAIISLYESSNIGNPFFEAMACGLPFISVDNGDTRKFVAHGFNGLLISEENIVVDLVRVFESIELGNICLEKISKNAAQYAENNILSWERRMDLEIEKVNAL